MLGNIFENPSLGKLSLSQVTSCIAQFIKADSLSSYRVVIGSDSHERKLNGSRELSLVGAIIVHRQGKGGRYFYQRLRVAKPHTIREKIYTETLFSLKLPGKCCPC